MKLFKAFTVLPILCSLIPAISAASSELSISGDHFVDSHGRTILLRGVNISGSAKNPPFLPLGGDVEKLDPLPALGVNVIRIVFQWEAYEPQPGVYDDSYLEVITQVIDAAWKRGIYTVVDMHEDGFSRFVGGSCGDGFPAWAVPQGQREEYDFNNPPECNRFWAAGVTMSLDMHSSFKAFYANENGTRQAFLNVWHGLAGHFRNHRGVIGYDLINEPWGDEVSEIFPLYQDVAEQIHAVDPNAFIFFEPNVVKASNTRLPSPTFKNGVYAPHYYNILELVADSWRFGTKNDVKKNFTGFGRKARDWNVPLFVGEFGVSATSTKAPDYMRFVFDQLDLRLASYTQWNYTPEWNQVRKDGWNEEDFSIVDDEGKLRPNFLYRPYVQKTAGTLLAQNVTYDSNGRFRSFHAKWRNVPAKGKTEVFLPAALISRDKISVMHGPTDIHCAYDNQKSFVLKCASESTTEIEIWIETTGETSGGGSP